MECKDCNCDTNLKALPKIIGGFLNITQRCNLACGYCFVKQLPLDMTYQTAKDAADFYANNCEGPKDIPSLNYFGGEPLLRWDDIIVPLTLYIRDKYGKNYKLSMTTNGILLDKEKLEFMKKHNIGFLFSIDGDKETQDKNRPFHNGKGSFDILVDKIPMFLEYNPNATFRSTVNNDNVYEMAHNYQFAIDMGYTNVFMIPNVFAEWTEEEKLELDNQLEKIADIYIANMKKGKRVDFNQFREAENKIRNIEGMAKTNKYRDRGINIPAFGRCGLGGSKFGSIGPNGDIYSCQEMVENPELGDKFVIGNIYTGMDEAKRWKVMSDFDPRNIRRSDGKTCRECELNQVCDGACSINNFFATGDLEIMPALLCDFYNMVIKQQRRINQELRPMAKTFS